jgi:hypothetical protein
LNAPEAPTLPTDDSSAEQQANEYGMANLTCHGVSSRRVRASIFPSTVKKRNRKQNHEHNYASIDRFHSVRRSLANDRFAASPE